MSQNKQYKSNHSPHPTSRQMPSQSLSNSHLRSQAPTPPLLPLLPFLLLCMTLRSTEYPSGRFRSTAPAVSPPSLLPSPSPCCRVPERGKKKIKSQSCAVTVQQQPKPSTVLAKNPKHSAMQPAMKKANATPARPITQADTDFLSSVKENGLASLRTARV